MLFACVCLYESLRPYLQNLLGSTPLHLAVHGYWPATTKMLLLAGADVSLFDHQGANVFTDAVLKGFY